MKNAFIREAESVNAGTKFTIRDTAQQHLGKNRERQLVYLRQKQCRETHLERKVMGAP